MCDVCEDGGYEERYRLGWRENEEGNGNGDSYCCDLDACCCPTAVAQRGGKRSTESLLVQSSDNIHLHLSIINKISMHFYELSSNSHNSSTQTGQQNE